MAGWLAAGSDVGCGRAAVEVLAANQVEVTVDAVGGYTPTRCGPSA